MKMKMMACWVVAAPLAFLLGACEETECDDPTPGSDATTSCSRICEHPATDGMILCDDLTDSGGMVTTVESLTPALMARSPSGASLRCWSTSAWGAVSPGTS